MVREGGKGAWGGRGSGNNLHRHVVDSMETSIEQATTKGALTVWALSVYYVINCAAATMAPRFARF